MGDREPHFFKGIALFTPAGDLVYCIDPTKQGRWHSHLCARLQEILQLPEPPHFLVPSYTATIDRWLDPRTNRVETLAEISPLVARYQALLNAVFGTGDLIWQIMPWQEKFCDPMILETYRSQFPQLWEEQDLVVRLEPHQKVLQTPKQGIPDSSPLASVYVLRLFVSGDNRATEQILKKVHQLLEQGLRSPYTLKVIDVFKYPEQAEVNQVAATPTLVRIFPEPVRRIVGKLEDTRRVLEIITMG